MEVTVAALSLAVVLVEWAEVDLQVATYSRGPETGSVLIRMWLFVMRIVLIDCIFA